MSARLARSSTSASSESLPLAWRSCLELDAAVEVVLDRLLAPAGDDEDVVDPGPHGLLHHVLDGRLVDDRQHLLGLRLGGGQEPGAQAGGGDDGLAHVGHGAVLLGGLRRQRALLAAAQPVEVVAVADHDEHARTPRTRRPRQAGRPTSAAASGKPTATATEPADAAPATSDRHDPDHRQHQGRHREQHHAIPAPVATPLPPRNRRVTGATWPSTAASPHATPTARLPGGQAHARRPARPWPRRRAARWHRPAGPSCGRCWTRPGCRSPPGSRSRPSRRPDQDRGGERAQEVGRHHEQPRQVHGASLRARRVCDPRGPAATLALSMFEC